MRTSLLALAALIATVPCLDAQTTPGTKAGTPTTPPAAAEAPAPISPKLDGYLKRWEEEMQKVQTLSAAMVRTDKDVVFGTTKESSGAAHYMKAGTGATTLNLALLELKEKGKADISEKFICTGTFLYQFRPASKEILAYEMPKPKPGQVSDESFLGFMFGMKAEEAKRRYVMKLAATQAAPDGEDQYYIYVDVTPRFADDKTDFKRARLVLNKDSYLPRRVWFEHPNGNETTWDIPALKTGVEMNRRAFDAPKVPTGWKLVPVQKTAGTPPGDNPPPRVVRPKN